MTKTMGDEIYMHSQIGHDGDGQYCKACNHRYGNAAAVELHRRAAGHIAAALTDAGFGLVADAKAEALDSAAADAEGMHEPAAPDCKEWADWLRARAAAVRGEG